MPRPIARDQVRELLARGAQLIEVLPADEYEEAHLPGAVNIPLEQLGRQMGGLRRDRPVITYCHDLQ